MFCNLAEIRTYTIQLYITHASIKKIKQFNYLQAVIQLVSKSLLGYFLDNERINEILNQVCTRFYILRELSVELRAMYNIVTICMVL